MGITASDGVNFELEDLDQTLTYNGDGTLNYIQVQYRPLWRKFRSSVHALS